jgi:hypothetical protein
VPRRTPHYLLPVIEPVNVRYTLRGHFGHRCGLRKPDAPLLALGSTSRKRAKLGETKYVVLRRMMLWWHCFWQGEMISSPVKPQPDFTSKPRVRGRAPPPWVWAWEVILPQRLESLSRSCTIAVAELHNRCRGVALTARSLWNPFGVRRRGRDYPGWRGFAPDPGL